MIGLIALAGAFGAICRFYIGRFIEVKVKHLTLWATTIINLSGSFLLGISLSLYHANILTELTYPFISIGFFGAFTTFSTFSYEAYSLLTKSKRKGFTYILVNMIIISCFASLAICFSDKLFT